MPALAQCDAFAYIYDQSGDPAPDVLVVLKRVIDASGNPILLGPKTTLTDSAGSFHFTLPELSTAFISARASALWNCPDGRAFTVPPGPSGELVPDFSLPSSTLVEPPLVYVGDVLSIPKASATQDGYLSAADFVAFEAGAADMGITQIDTGAGLTGGPITDTGTIGLAPVSGVAGTWSNPSSITVNAYGQIIAIAGVADTTAPVITAILATVTGQSVTITWTTDDLSDSQVDYGTTTGYGTPTPPDATLTQSHSVTITGLLPSQGYHYVVKSRNTATLLKTSPDNTFTTGAVTDTTPPVITLAVTPVTVITDTAATINWTTDELADSLVEYSTDTSYATHTPPADHAGVTIHAITLSSLLPLTTYHYRVQSSDVAGNPAIPVTGTFMTMAAAPPVDLLTGLAAYWKLDEATGNRLDSTVGANTLTPAAAFATSTSKTGFNICPHFVGDANYLYAALPTFMRGLSTYTMAAWIQIEDKSVNRTFISKAGAAGHDDYVLSYEGAQLRYTVQSDTGTYFHVAAAEVGDPAINTWYLVVFWHNLSDSTIHIQVNNGPDNSFTLLEPLGTCAATFTIGSYGAAIANLWYGLIDEVAIWYSRILDADTRAGLWNGGAGKPFGTW